VEDAERVLEKKKEKGWERVNWSSLFCELVGWVLVSSGWVVWRADGGNG